MCLLSAFIGKDQQCPWQMHFANNLLTIKFKGILMKFKNVAIFVEWLIFEFFFDIVKLRHKPLNFARAIFPYATG